MPSTDSGTEHGNALPILNEIRHALDRLLESGETTVIDLGALPMGPQDEAGETLARFIEIAFVPELLMSQAEDVADSAAALAKKLGQAQNS
jgi:hypothetical protein